MKRRERKNTINGKNIAYNTRYKSLPFIKVRENKLQNFLISLFDLSTTESKSGAIGLQVEGGTQLPYIQPCHMVHDRHTNVPS